MSHKEALSVPTVSTTDSIKIIKSKSLIKSANHSCQKYNNGANTSRNLIEQALKQRIETLDPNNCGVEEENSFYVADLGEVYRQHLRWKINLPRIRPYYAVKCNPDLQVIRLLSKLGTGFDCASMTEIQQVLDLGIDADSIIYAHTCKSSSSIRFAETKGVKKMTFDSIDELFKIKKLFPNAELFLRIATDDSSSNFQLSKKYGAHMNATEELLDHAKSLGLCVVGVSFHIGSNSSSTLAFRSAVQDARTVFDQATARGMNLNMLDVGGGFSNETFEPMAEALNLAIDDLIPSHTTIIAEPGRYYVATAFTLASHIIGRRSIEDFATKNKRYMLFLNDGIYGSFLFINYEGEIYQPRVLRAGNQFYFGEEVAKPKSHGIKYSIWGPTCDSRDRISKNICFQFKLEVGDWFYFDNMGAYTCSCSSQFNGFLNDFHIIYVVSEPGAASLLVVN